MFPLDKNMSFPMKDEFLYNSSMDISRNPRPIVPFYFEI
jgi:hypothetical protein